MAQVLLVIETLFALLLFRQADVSADSVDTQNIAALRWDRCAEMRPRARIVTAFDVSTQIFVHDVRLRTLAYCTVRMAPAYQRFSRHPRQIVFT